MIAPFASALLEGASQIKAEPSRAMAKIFSCLTGRRLQIFARPSADIEDIHLVIDQHGRRGKMLQEQLIPE